VVSVTAVFAPDGDREGDDRRSDRAQIVLVAAAVVAVAFLSMTLAYAQLGYDADRDGAGAVDVAAVSDVDRSLSASLRAAARDVDGEYRWADRRQAGEAVRDAVEGDIERVQRVHADESRSLSVTFDDSTAAAWAREHCPGGAGREFGRCRSIDGVVVQERAGETTVVAAAVRIRIVSPAERTTVTTVLRVTSSDRTA
jgi:hypothetical protein